jgi:hypothetical protein
MTPRALFTAIGATAIAFAIIIGTAASGAINDSAPDSTLTSVAPGNRTQTQVFGWTVSPGDSEGTAGAGVRRALHRDSCSIAV